MRRKLFALAAITVLLLFTVSPLALAQGFDGDEVVVNESFVLPAGQTLDGNLVVAFGGTATLEEGSIVRGDVMVGGGDLDAAGEIRGNVGMFGGTVLLRSSAVVTGDLASFGGRVSREQGATVRGDTFEGLRGRDFNLGEGRDRPGIDETPVRSERSAIERFVLWQLGTIGTAILLSLLGALLVVLAPRPMQRLTRTISEQAALSFGVGLLTWIVALLAGGILLIACGLGLLVWLALLAAVVLGWLAFALWLGWALLSALKVRTASSVAEIVLGVFIITFLTRLPWCGFLFSAIVGSIGLGAVVLTRFGTRESDGRILPPASPAPPRGPVAPGPTFTDLMDGGTVRRAPQTGETTVTTPEATDLLVASFGEAGTADEAAPIERAPVEAPAVEPGTASEVEVSEMRDLSAPPDLALLTISGIDEVIAERLVGSGIRTLADLAAAEPAYLAAVTGVPEGRVLIEDWIGQAQRMA